MRSLFVIFLLSGINLEANIAMSKEQEKRAVIRAMAIAALDADGYSHLLAENEAALKALCVVTSCQLVQASKQNDSFCKVTLNCTARCGGKWRQPMLRLSQKCPTLAHAAEIMLEYILEHHEACIGDAQSGCGSCECEGSCSTSERVDAFARMRDSQRRLGEQRAAELRVRSAEQNLEQEQKRMRLLCPADTLDDVSVRYLNASKPILILRQVQRVGFGAIPNTYGRGDAQAQQAAE